MTVGILVDMNLSPEWGPFLAGRGYPAKHWSDVGSPSASDETLMAWASTHGMLVLTRDLDFGTILALTQGMSPSVVQIRGDKVLPEEIGDAVLDALSRFQAELASGAIVTLDESRNRVRILPI